MKASRIALVVLLFLCFGAALWLWRRGEPAIPAAVPTAGVGASPMAAPVAAPGANAPSAMAGSGGGAGSEPPSPALLGFLRTESQALNATKVDVGAAEARAKEVAAQMGEPDIRYAQRVLLNSAAPANERVLSAYLLGFALPRSVAALTEVLETPLPLSSGRAEPHSVDEVKAMQEKALRIMAMEALAEQAKKDPAARDTLARLEAKETDPALKKMYQQKLRELGAR